MKNLLSRWLCPGSGKTSGALTRAWRHWPGWGFAGVTDQLSKEVAEYEDRHEPSSDGEGSRLLIMSLFRLGHEIAHG